MAKKPGNPRLLRPVGYLSPNEAGVVLGVTGATIMNHIRRGKIKAVRAANGYNWIKPADLKDLSFRKPNRKPKPLKPVRRRTITFNAEAAKELGFSVEKANPGKNG